MKRQIFTYCTQNPLNRNVLKIYDRRGKLTRNEQKKL